MECIYHAGNVEDLRGNVVQKKEKISYSVIESPVGPLTLVASIHALVRLTWGRDEENLPVDAKLCTGFEPNLVLARTKKQLSEYFAGRRSTFDIPLAPIGSTFQLKVWEQLLKIPYGTHITYGQQAARLGSPNAARAVGAANGKNPISIIIPCHRVIGASGHLTGFAGGIETKRKLLILEGVRLLSS